MVARATLDVAFEILEENKGPLSFFNLWTKVAEAQGYDEGERHHHISRFYTNLSLDGRFVNLGDNTWDLRKNNTYDKVHIDINDVYSDVEMTDNDEEEEAELKEEIGAFDDTPAEDDYDEEETDDKGFREDL
ncbi:MAG: DNA-directed RNA polymerase subunit delta [Bacilli bacterium]|jgi:DNA-directed RNA polymerase subunit delta|nr:DNA-directed RNA polymerase subunit delta [Bacilli bacterium]MCH4235716.1 DNA-directed RNA polymerase subunit delta [Bacilli bacterium]HMM00411.1 DNA-directed RNA polymerase subunit delta [Bacilli bacterium]